MHTTLVLLQVTSICYITLWSGFLLFTLNYHDLNSLSTSAQRNCQQLHQSWSNALCPTSPVYADVMSTILYQTMRWANVGKITGDQLFKLFCWPVFGRFSARQH